MKEHNGKDLTRTGIRRLRSGDDLASHFLAGHEESAQDEDFAELFEASFDPVTAQKAMCEKESTEHPLSSGRLRRNLTPRHEIDLHGLTSSEAVDKAQYYIHEASGKGISAVRIITGKGLHSEGSAVLREVIEQTLVRLKRSGIVLGFAWEKRTKNRSGAVIVYLGKEKRPKE